MTAHSEGSLPGASEALAVALRALDRRDHALAVQLAGIATAVLTEASRNQTLRAALRHAIRTELGSQTPVALRAERPTGAVTTPGGGHSGSRRTNRRKPGPWDPFVVFDDIGADGLRERLSRLDLEQLRDILAEHGMDADKLAMKWKDPQRVIGRIVERVEDRAGKGSAFRGG